MAAAGLHIWRRNNLTNLTRNWCWIDLTKLTFSNRRRIDLTKLTRGR
jgi:hypothetical protein